MPWAAFWRCIPSSRKIFELFGNLESKFQQLDVQGDPSSLMVQFEHSGVPRNLTCCPNDDCYSNGDHFPGWISHSPPCHFQSVRTVLVVMWRSTPLGGLTLHDQNCQNFYHFQQQNYAITRFATFLLALGGSGSHLGSWSRCRPKKEDW